MGTVNIVPQVLLCILFPLVFVVPPAGMYLYYIVTKRLKDKHPNQWHSLGSPGLIRNNSIGNSCSTLWFLWRKKFLQLDDPLLVKRCNMFVILLRVWMVIFTLIVISFIWSVVLEKLK